MSIRAINWALELPIPPTPKLVLVVIADYADDKGYAFPGIDTIARRSSVSERTVIRVLADLEENGYVTKERRMLESGKRTSNGYLLHPERSQVTNRHVTSEADQLPTVSPTEEPSVEPPVTTTARGRATRFPDGFTWNNAHSLKATSRHVDVEVEFQKFTDYHLAKGSTFVDWDRAFHTWLNNARPEPGMSQRAVTPRSSRDEEIENFLGRSLGLDEQRGISA